MKQTNDNSAESHQAWSRQFAEEAMKRAAHEIYAFQNHSAIACRRKMAEAALAIGWMVIYEAGALRSEKTVQASRDNIIGGLTDVIQHSYPDGTHLGHDIVDAIAEALGEHASREDSTYS